MSSGQIGFVLVTSGLGTLRKLDRFTFLNTLLIFRGRLGYGEKKRAGPYNKDVNDV